MFTHLINADARQLHDTLAQGGFRRSQNIAYRPACDGCSACVSVRVPVSQFEWTKSFRKLMRRNRHIVANTVPAKATAEQYAVFRRYIDKRHSNGGMSDMSMMDYSPWWTRALWRHACSNIVRCPSLRCPDLTAARVDLIAAALTDVLEDGLSMIYSFFAPEYSASSFGTYMVLDHILRAEQAGLPYVYLGYWVNGSSKMDYKARFLPQERLTQTGWLLHTREDKGLK